MATRQPGLSRGSYQLLASTRALTSRSHKKHDDGRDDDPPSSFRTSLDAGWGSLDAARDDWTVDPLADAPAPASDLPPAPVADDAPAFDDVPAAAPAALATSVGPSAFSAFDACLALAVMLLAVFVLVISPSVAPSAFFARVSVADVHPSPPSNQSPLGLACTLFMLTLSYLLVMLGAWVVCSGLHRWAASVAAGGTRRARRRRRRLLGSLLAPFVYARVSWSRWLRPSQKPPSAAPRRRSSLPRSQPPSSWSADLRRHWLAFAARGVPAPLFRSSDDDGRCRRVYAVRHCGTILAPHRLLDVLLADTRARDRRRPARARTWRLARTALAVAFLAVAGRALVSADTFPFPAIVEQAPRNGTE